MQALEEAARAQGGSGAAQEGETPAALARLYGQALHALPRDLYIPPDALQVFLEAFEGPLDLLLYLIRKQNFNILDIPVAEVTRQYMAYVEEIRRRNLDLAAEYLLMAALLVEIKSRLLLPQKAADAVGEEEGEDPRADLVRRLLEYEKFKAAAQQIQALPQAGRDFAVARAAIGHAAQAPLAQIGVADLLDAWREMAQRARLVQRHCITREALSVREYMGRVLKALQGRRFAEFAALLPPPDADDGSARAVLVVTFIALLELAREALVEITQGAAFAPLYVRLAYRESEASAE